MFFLSPKDMSFSPSDNFNTSLYFVTGTDSPVKAASSIFKLALSIILPSAGTASPASNNTISPTTTSSLLIIHCLLFLITLHVEAVIFCNASMAFSDLFSWYTPKIPLIITTINIIKTSANDSLAYAAVTPETIAATISMIIIGFVNSLINFINKGVFLLSSNLFNPPSLNLILLSSSLKPFSSLFKCFNITSYSCKYSLIISPPLFL